MSHRSPSAVNHRSASVLTRSIPCAVLSCGITAAKSRMRSSPVNKSYSSVQLLGVLTKPALVFRMTRASQLKPLLRRARRCAIVVPPPIT